MHISLILIELHGHYRLDQNKIAISQSMKSARYFEWAISNCPHPGTFRTRTTHNIKETNLSAGNRKQILLTSVSSLRENRKRQNSYRHKSPYRITAVPIVQIEIYTWMQVYAAATQFLSDSQWLLIHSRYALRKRHVLQVTHSMRTAHSISVSWGICENSVIFIIISSSNH